MDGQAIHQHPGKWLVDPANTSCICTVSQYSPLSGEVGQTILWLPPQATVYIGRDEVTKVTDMSCSTVQVGLTHFTMGCKASQGMACSCFILLDNVGEGVCISRSRVLMANHYDYLKHGEYFVLGKSSAFIITIISDRQLLAETRRFLREDLSALRKKYSVALLSKQ